MSDSIDPIGAGLTPQLVRLALDGALATHQVIATNIANADTAGYRPMISRFDSLIEELRERATDRTQDAETSRVMQSVRAALAGNPVTYDPRFTHVELDMQVAALARNTLQYEALLTAQGKLGQIMQLVIGEGRM